MLLLSDNDRLPDGGIVCGFLISPLLRDWDAARIVEHFNSLPSETVKYYQKHAQRLADLASSVLRGDSCS